MANSPTIKVQASGLLDALPMCGVDGCPNAGDVPAVLETAGALGWRIRMRVCSSHMLEALALEPAPMPTHAARHLGTTK